MITLDTNVLVRVFMDDATSADQVQAARDLVRQYKQVFVPQIVQVELAWVLISAFKLSKKKLISILETLKDHPCFILQSPHIFSEALQGYYNNKCDFSDLIILLESRLARTNLYTFDKKLIAAGANQC